MSNWTKYCPYHCTTLPKMNFTGSHHAVVIVIFVIFSCCPLYLGLNLISVTSGHANTDLQVCLYLRHVYEHYSDVIMGTMASQITSLTIVYSTVYSGADQSKHQSSASLAFVWGNHRGPVNSSHKWPVTRKMFPFDDVIMRTVVPEAGISGRDE